MTSLFVHGFTGSPRCGDVLGVTSLEVLGHHPRWRETRVNSFSEEVARLAARVPANATLIGYSMGARLALAVALQTEVARLVLISGRAGIDDKDRPARVTWEDEIAADLSRDGVDAFATKWEALPLFATRRNASAPAVRMAYAEQQRRRRAHDPEGLSAALRVLGTGRMPDLRPELSRVHARTDLIVGALDTRYVSIADAMAHELFDARVHVVPNAGHDLIVEAGARVRALLNDPALSRSASKKTSRRTSKRTTL